MMRANSLLLEIDRDTFEVMSNSTSAVAVKFFSAVERLAADLPKDQPPIGLTYRRPD